MFNFSFGELLILGVIGLLVIGPKQLPQVAKILARTINEFKKSINDVSNTVKEELQTDVLKKQVTNVIKDGLDLNEPAKEEKKENS